MLAHNNKPFLAFRKKRKKESKTCKTYEPILKCENNDSDYDILKLQFDTALKRCANFERRIVLFLQKYMCRGGNDLFQLISAVEKNISNPHVLC